MANLALAVVAFAAFFAIVTSFATSWLDGTGRVAEGFRVARVADAAVGRTSLKENTRCVNPMGTSTTFRIANNGQSDLRNFSQWTLSAMYKSATGTTVQTLEYTASDPPSDNQWTVTGIQLPNGTAEVFQRGIIDPGEEAAVSIRVNPGIWASSANSIALTTDTGRTASINLTGDNQCGYYLHNNPTPPSGATSQQANLSADGTFPGQPTLYNYDQDRDAAAGRLIVKGASTSTESDLTKYQNWRTAALGKDLVLAGTVRVKLFGAIKDFDTTKAGSVRVYLRDYNPSGGAYTEIANASLTATPWDSGATGTWVEKTVSVTGVNYTVAAGRQLEIKLIVLTASGDDMWFAYDTVSYPAFVEIPEVKTLYFHSETRYVSDTKYNQLQSTAHEGGYYLHDNPTPPTAATSAQANLTMTQVYPSATTLYNYDLNNDAVAGRRIVKGGTGATESDLTKYQNWRTTALGEDTRIRGVVVLDFWSMVGSFSTSSTGSVTAYLRDYNPSGGTYTEIANKTLTAGPWDAAASGTWVHRFIEISVSDYTLARGRQLELKLIVSSTSTSDMHFAYDTTTYVTNLKLPGVTETDPAGNAFTDSINPGSSTGRFMPATNSGRYVWPLEGYTRITDATWTVTYRVKRNAYGFVWFTNARDVTPGTTGAWVNVDLSTHVPTTATGALFELINTHATQDRKAMVRGTEDTTDYVALYDERLDATRHRYQVVKVDSNRQVQAYIQTSVINIKLLAYTIGDDPVYRSQPADITPGVLNLWTAIDVSSLVDTDATGVVLLVDNGLTTNQVYGIRETGSTYSQATRNVAGRGNTMYMVGLDANKKFDAFWVTSSVKIFLVAQTKQSVVFYTNDKDVTDPLVTELSTWKSYDADDAPYSIPSEANGLIFYAYNGDALSGRDIQWRPGGSSSTSTRSIGALIHFQGASGIDSSNVWNQWQSSLLIDVAIAAYTTGSDPNDADVHADVDVVVRKANGELRATLATDAANTANIPGGSWVTMTATTTISEYTVVDQTDYLEIGLFGHVTRNNNPTAAVLYFRIDDSALLSSNRTRIANVAFYRE